LVNECAPPVSHDYFKSALILIGSIRPVTVILDYFGRRGSLERLLAPITLSIGAGNKPRLCNVDSTAQVTSLDLESVYRSSLRGCRPPCELRCAVDLEDIVSRLRPGAGCTGNLEPRTLSDRCSFGRYQLQRCTHCESVVHREIGLLASSRRFSRGRLPIDRRSNRYAGSASRRSDCVRARESLD
jgi:hypothetical protein